MQLTGNRPTFGTTYKFHNETEAMNKQIELRKQKIDSAVEFKSSQGILQVLTWLVHTNENGTTDLTDFRNRSKAGNQVK